MKFSELISKITVTGQNQAPDKNAVKKGDEFLKAANKHLSIIQEKENNIQCRVNGKARKLQKETTESETVK